MNAAFKFWKVLRHPIVLEVAVMALALLHELLSKRRRESSSGGGRQQRPWDDRGGDDWG
jgi:hypothetical protein